MRACWRSWRGSARPSSPALRTSSSHRWSVWGHGSLPVPPGSLPGLEQRGGLGWSLDPSTRVQFPHVQGLFSLSHQVRERRCPSTQRAGGEQTWLWIPSSPRRTEKGGKEPASDSQKGNVDKGVGGWKRWVGVCNWPPWGQKKFKREQLPFWDQRLEPSLPFSLWSSSLLCLCFPLLLL